MNIYQRIIQDHRMIRNMIEDLMQTDNSQIEKRDFLFHQLERLFISHTNAQELTLYQGLMNSHNPEAQRKVIKARREHDLASDILEELKSISLESEKFLDKLEHFKIIFEEHMDEEEDETFEIASELLDFEEQALMSEEMETFEEDMHQIYP